MHVLLLEPYDTGSHAVWMRGYQAHSQHDVRILSLEVHTLEPLRERSAVLPVGLDLQRYDVFRPAEGGRRSATGSGVISAGR